MIVFDLKCAQTHVFEAWFGSSEDYETQRARGLVSCPVCGDADIGKAVMAPAVPRKGNSIPDDAHAKKRLELLAAVQAKLEAEGEYVGRDFARRARAVHEGAEASEKPLYGETTLAEAKALLEDGVPVAPLPFRPRKTLDA